MRWRLDAIALLTVLVAPASAETLAEKTGINALLDRPPAAADVLTEIHQFDLFVGGAAGIADTRGTDALRKQSRAEVERADAREKQIARLAGQLGVTLSDDPSTARANQLGGLQGKVGADFMTSYRAAMVDEARSAQSVLQRYLAKPDHESVTAFAARALPTIEAVLRASSD
jgi:predicted outer membrane protein